MYENKNENRNESSTKFKIAVLPGDGIGPEVMDVALKVLDIVSMRYNIMFSYDMGHIGGAAIDRFGVPLPEETLDICTSSDAVLLGSIGGPKWDNLPPQQRPEFGGLLALRKSLDLFANIRPVKIFDALKEISPLAPSRIKGNIDIVTFRELSSGIYFGQPKKLDDDEGIDTEHYRRPEIERIARAAFRAAQS